ncbi:hypothetical protein BHE74_00053678 [Ensete ventricosum]|nr:hypothetical protein BHE74_00053678 [Ensete ventricosum]
MRAPLSKLCPSLLPASSTTTTTTTHPRFRRMLLLPSLTSLSPLARCSCAPRASSMPFASSRPSLPSTSSQIFTVAPPPYSSPLCSLSLSPLARDLMVDSVNILVVGGSERVRENVRVVLLNLVKSNRDKVVGDIREVVVRALVDGDNRFNTRGRTRQRCFCKGLQQRAGQQRGRGGKGHRGCLGAHEHLADGDKEVEEGSGDVLLSLDRKQVVVVVIEGWPMRGMTLALTKGVCISRSCFDR